MVFFKVWVNLLEFGSGGNLVLDLVFIVLVIKFMILELGMGFFW